MLNTAFQAASCLLFPKICETCEELLPARDTRGVCGACANKILKITPPFCRLCGRTAPGEKSLCGQCRDTGFYFDRAYAAAYYEGKMQELLQAFKFSGRRSLKKYFSDELVGFISKYLDLSNIDALVSVPMDVKKENARGFNQAQLVTRLTAKKIKKEDLSPYLKRKKSSSTQSLLNKNQRRRNIEGSFFVSEPKIFSGKKILLIDDILTTGFTASECSKTLKAAGAISVTLLAAARGL